jgi:hypothetical protein
LPRTCKKHSKVNVWISRSTGLFQFSSTRNSVQLDEHGSKFRTPAAFSPIYCNQPSDLPASQVPSIWTNSKVHISSTISWVNSEHVSNHASWIHLISAEKVLKISLPYKDLIHHFIPFYTVAKMVIIQKVNKYLVQKRTSHHFINICTQCLSQYDAYHL